MIDEEGAAWVSSYYEGLQIANEYPPKFNPGMNEVLEKLPVKMTSVEEWNYLERVTSKLILNVLQVFGRIFYLFTCFQSLIDMG